MELDKTILDKLSKGVMPIQFRMGSLDQSDLEVYLKALGLTKFVPTIRRV